ncbi:MAG: hypothetical protein RR426_00340 [Oscillospiraceae bacterium]
MEDYDWSKTRQEKPPLWQSTEGKLRETAPRGKQGGQDHLTGYQPTVEEKEQGERPREMARLSGSYGDVAVGVSRKKEITMVVSKQRSREGVAATGEDKHVHAQSASKIHLTRGNFQTNSNDGKTGAVSYRESRKKQPGKMLAQFQALMNRREQAVLQEQVPFLSQKEEKEELRVLEARADAMRAENSPEAHRSLREIESRKQYLHRSLAEKTAQERRLRLTLQKAEEESHRQAGERADLPRNGFFGILSPEEPPEEPPEDGAAGAGEDKPQTPGQTEEPPEESAPISDGESAGDAGDDNG